MTRRSPRTALFALFVALLVCVMCAPVAVATEVAPLDIAGTSVEPGQRVDVSLSLGESSFSQRIDIPVVIAHGTSQGPTLCLVGGIHGDELNGIQIVREFADTLDPSALAGTVIAVPIANIYGFLNHSRYTPDRRDLNRHFPGRADGSIAARVANVLSTAVLRHCTIVVDFHTAATTRSNLPQLRGDLKQARVLEFARAFGAETIIHNPGLPGTLRAAARTRGIPSLLYEAGEAMRFQREEIDIGIRGIQRLMVHLGMTEMGERERERRSVHVYPETRWIRSPQGGLLELDIALGEKVHAGQKIGRIYDLLRRSRFELTTKRAGRVIGVATTPHVLPGLAVVHLGIENGRFDQSEIGDELDEERPE